ncbi:ChaB family protein, partial [Lysobacter sp. D1-1-M9]
MPYDSISKLPEQVRDNVPKHGQEIYKEAFNSAWDEYKDADDR